GDLGVLAAADARWFAKVQALYELPLARDQTCFFGGVPGHAEPYGFVSADVDGALCTVVNPTLSIRTIELPQLEHSAGRILFRDAGFVPDLAGTRLTLGSGQMALAGFGRYAAPEFDLGQEQDVRIPTSIRPLDVQVEARASGGFAASVLVPEAGSILLLCQQRKPDGAPAKNASGKGIALTAEQAGRTLPILQHQPDVSLLTGASWAAGTVQREDLLQTGAVRFRGNSPFPTPVSWEVQAYAIE
ncbi:MAG TPA: hypothetical protein VFO35_10945, partial [Steroidobacteraceae bacterium]|nr:hypothetical protein [Steroidobacteraceae bacterium]